MRYAEPARHTTRAIRIRRTRVAGLLAAIAATAAALGASGQETAPGSKGALEVEALAAEILRHAGG